MAFSVPEDMFLAADEIACAAYIFGPEVSNPTSSDELLVTTGANFISRKCLLTLVPGEQVVQDVLDILACHLTNEHRKIFKSPSMWYLPTIFSQLALSWTRSPDNLREQFANKYMDKVDNVSRVTESTRMRLAIDLVTGGSNLKKVEVTSKAHGYMKELIEKQSKLRTV
ncbi:hypothetical protein PIB30_061069 [Stylosanthes scabra]|uniref:Uncharacterized protein n=1 Tax=Stylosanthes scabra TaxID=79078 RepID=A0ABU6YI81_9FABA|nr:hypothetical protein [Stylosanthes scabra]